MQTIVRRWQPRGPRILSRYVYTDLLLTYNAALACTLSHDFPSMHDLLGRVPLDDRVFFFKNRQPISFCVDIHPETGLRALRIGNRWVLSSYQLAVELRVDLRRGVSLRHRLALMNIE